MEAINKNLFILVLSFLGGELAFASSDAQTTTPFAEAKEISHYTKYNEILLHSDDVPDATLEKISSSTWQYRNYNLQEIKNEIAKQRKDDTMEDVELWQIAKYLYQNEQKLERKEVPGFTQEFSMKNMAGTIAIKWGKFEKKERAQQALADSVIDSAIKHQKHPWNKEFGLDYQPDQVFFTKARSGVSFRVQDSCVMVEVLGEADKGMEYKRKVVVHFTNTIIKRLRELANTTSTKK